MLAYSKHRQVQKAARWLGLANAVFILVLFGVFSVDNEFTRRELGHMPCMLEAIEFVAIFLNLPARLLGYHGLAALLPDVAGPMRYLGAYLSWAVLAYLQWRFYPSAVRWLARHREWMRWLRPLPILATLTSLAALWWIWPRIESFDSTQWERLMSIPVYLFSIAGAALTLQLLLQWIEARDSQAA